MYNDLIRAYEETKRRAQLNGVPVSREDTMRALAPIYAQYAKDAVTKREMDLKGQALDLRRQELAQNKDIFNKRYQLEEDMRSDARPWQYANLAISGLGTLGGAYYANQQDELYRQRLAKLMQMYGG